MNLGFLFEIEKNKPEFQVKENVEDLIYRILTRSQFRIGPVQPNIEKILKDKIHKSVKEELPITLILAVGGFKNYRLTTAPHIDWGEVFQVHFVLNSLYEIAEIYDPGLHLEYSGDAEAMVVADNLKQEWIDIYKNEFDKLVRFYDSRTPSNIKIMTRDFRDFYTIDEIESEVDARLSKIDWSDSEIRSLVRKRMPHAINNFCFNGRRNLDYLVPKEKEFELQKSIFKHKLWLDVDYERRREYLEGGANIPILHKTNDFGCYAIKSCVGSDIQYWIGSGLLKSQSGKYVPTILSANQLEKNKNKISQVDVDSAIESQKLLALSTIGVLYNS